MSRAASFNHAAAEGPLAAGIAGLNLEMPASAQTQLLSYLAELHKWNAAYNLTAVREPAEMVTRHLLDALAVLPHLPETGRVLDVGSGGGIPGLVLAIARPALHVAVLDSNGKKARFLRHAVRTLGLDHVEVIEARAEDHAPPERYGIVISRAFASLADFVACSRQALVADGRWLAMKGKVTAEERAALPADILLEAIHPLAVPGLSEARCLVVLSAAHP